jgi:hypothetical protein
MKTLEKNEWMEFNRFGITAMIILINGCLGGLTMGLGAVQYTATLILVVVPTMLTLSLLLAVVPMRWIVASATFNLAIDLCLMLFYLCTN